MRGYDFRIALSDLAAAEPSSRSHRRGEGPVKLGEATGIPCAESIPAQEAHERRRKHEGYERHRSHSSVTAFASIRRLGVRLSAHANGAGEGAVN